ncbi:MAG TPA: PIN domain-containing protein [Candidatus Deferrimicrobium sp.]|nr:PIN domain-containing protein [Candidatus Deferrimicrobium sp.]
MKYLIDTNIFLEVLLKRKRKEACKIFLTKVRTGEIRAIFSHFALYSIEILLSSQKKYNGLRKFLRSLTRYKGLIIYNTRLSDQMKIIEIMKKYALDFDDALQLCVALINQISGIVSYDPHFDKNFTDINFKRLEPENITSS